MAAGPEIAASQAVDELNRQIAALALENTRLAHEHARLGDDLAQSLDYQTAISELLAVISRSASAADVASVLDTMLAAAGRLCGVKTAAVAIRQGASFRYVATLGHSPQFDQAVRAREIVPERVSIVGRAILEKQVVQVADVTADPDYAFSQAVSIDNLRTVLGVPLLRDGEPVGVISLSRDRVELFSERQIALVRTFADQAVIALENARLLGELRESLDQQTATSEILQVINASPSDLAPVFEAMLERAVQLSCSAYGMMNVWEDGRYRTVALRGVPQGLMERWVSAPAPGPRNALSRIASGEDIVHIEDLTAYESYRLGDERSRALVETGGARSLLAVALRKDGKLLGVLTAYRQEVRPFTDKQIALLRSFAQQAVIAMENARLINETREALERQTATTEILEVINSSPGSLTPVFDTILAKATELCEAEFGILWLYKDGFIRAAAHFNVPPAYAEFLGQGAHPVNPINAHGRLLRGESVVHIADITADEAYVAADPLRRALVELGGGRAQITVALRKDGAFLGDFVIYRKQPGPFSDKHILLLQGFAAQAVIAIENARLLGELRESLDQQTATSDVLRTISRSSVDLGSVLETLVGTVARLCRGDQAYLFRREGNLHHLLASFGLSDEAREYLRARPFEPSRGNTSGRATLERRTIHIPDVLADPEYTYEGISVLGFRTALGIPLMREDTVIGVFVVARTVVAPFTDKEIELASGFADQAVIAIENARLFEELRDRQAELRVTLDNTGDGVVMFDADFKLASWNRNFQEMLDISDAFVAGRPRLDDYVGLLAGRGELGEGEAESIVASYRERATRQWSAERTRPDGRIVEVRNNPVPDGGAVLIYSDITARKQAEAQIAAARDAAEEALEQQTATAEILRAISQSPTDVQPVLDAVVKAAVRFCGAADAVIALREGDGAVFVAHEGPIVMALGSSLPLNRESAGGRALVDGRTCHLPDIASLDPVEFAAAHQFSRAHGFRAALAAPLLRNDAVIGAVVLRKDEVAPFTPRQIELLETFAAQAVIAIENVRLFTELRESLEQQTATADILKAIAGSPTDVQPVLDAVANAALRFCGAPDAVVWLRDGDDNVVAAHHGTLTASPGMRRPIGTATFSGQAMLEGRTRQVADVDALDATVHAGVVALARQHKWRSSAAAPMMHGGKAIGCVVLRKPEPGLLSARQIALLETFAAQAVIAIENVRLFTELRQRTDDLTQSLERQTATADILKVIASSPSDVQPVFQAIAESSNRLIGGVSTAVYRLADDMLHLMSFTTTAISAEADAALKALFPAPLSRVRAFEEAVRTRQVCRISDTELEFADDSQGLALSRLRGWRSLIVVPLIDDDEPIGLISVSRVKPGLVGDQHGELLKTFAAQAVIAIRNARLFNDLSEALEQQTATADILRVISQSPTDVAPVLSAVANAALKFCGARDAQVALRDGDVWSVVAHEGPVGALRGTRQLNRQTAPGRAMVDGEVVQIADLQSAEANEFQEARELGTRLGFRSALAAPLLRDDVAIGAISLRRPEAGVFTPNQVELLRSFAAQAVIAIENVRLFTELRESLEQQTAMADILRVISQSPTDVQPVFDAVAESSVRLCGAGRASIFRFDGEVLRMVASHNCDPEFVKWVKQHPIPPGRHSASARAALERRTIHVPDVLADPEYSYGAKDVEAIRTVLGVPILKGEDLLGVMMIFHLEVRPFTDKQIALVETFADQAAIAIENVRLFTELRESLERLKAAQANLIQSEKMASLGQLTAGIAHEIKNPLNFVNNFAVLSVELLDELTEIAGGALATLDEGKRAEVDETIELLVGNLGKIAEHGKRADGIVKSMLSHSRGGSGEWTPSDINALVEEALNLAYHGARAQDNEFNVTLERDFVATPRPIEVVPQDVTRVFLNLFGNGFYAVGKRRRADKLAGFRPTLKVSTRDLGEAVEVRVRDNGTGIPPDVRQKLFQPFFTTKPTGEGTGLGLSISYDIVTQQHGGTIEVESEPGSFTEFTVRLPRRRVQTSERA